MQAYIGGLVPMSTVDWPRNICTVVFFAGCDFKCPYCQNSSIVDFKEEYLTDLKLVKQQVRKNLDFIDALLFSGGEPCLQPTALLELATFAKKLELMTGIETNGTKPAVLRTLSRKGLLDFVGLDLKAPLEDRELFERATNSRTFFKTTEEVIESVRKSMKILKDERVEVEVRTTIVPGLIFRKEDLLKIAGEIGHTGWRWTLQQYRPDIGDILDHRYKDVLSPTRSFMENLRKSLLKEHPNLRVDLKAV
jgi:pyruvate formate lyase activating enzyme